MMQFLHGLGRRVVAGALVYALVLQAFAFAAEIAQAGSASAQPAAGFVLCTHGGGAALPDTPAPRGDNHCPFCLAGIALYVNASPPGAPRGSALVFVCAAWPAAAPSLVALFVSESAWPRGPPSAA